MIADRAGLWIRRGRLARGIVAWLGALGVVAVAGVASSYAYEALRSGDFSLPASIIRDTLVFAYFIVLFAAVPSAILGPPIIWAGRALAVRRPAADLLIGACMAGVLALFLYSLARDSAAALVGALGGYAYWRFAGRPRPPYGDAAS